MPIDTSELAFPKPTKKSKSKGYKKKKEKEVTIFAYEVDHMIDFYETHRNDMASVENYRNTKKLKDLSSQWLRDVMQSQKCDDVADVVLAWEQTIIHAAEKVHSSHKVGSFINMFWLIKNDSNYLDVLEGKYDREFNKRTQTPQGGRTVAWGDPKDFEGVDGGASGIVV